MKILITGTHFTPAQAVVEELKKNKGVEIVYVGRNTTMEGDKSPSMESQVLPRLGVKFIPLIAGRLQISFTIYTIPSLLKIPIGFIQALYIILSFRPDVILSFGGYVSVPVVIAGWLFSIPIIVHEQTLVSGLANKINSLFADKIALSFDLGQKFNKLTVLTGNPIRRDIIEGAKPINQKELRFRAMNRLDLVHWLIYPLGGLRRHLGILDKAKIEKLPVILVSCGNQGSHIINLAIEKSLISLIKIACIIHITGNNKFNDFERLEKLQSDHYLVKKWIGEEYGSVLSKVDLVISRAGINTLSELAYIGKPALVIPLPYLYQDEQNKNAKFFEQLNLVKVLPQSKLSSKSLLENIRLMLNSLAKLKEKAKVAKKVIIPDSAKRLALETMVLARLP